MGPVGVPEMFAIFVVALILFGPKKLPELGRTLGKALTEFRRAKNELKSTFETHLQELERETRLSETSSQTHTPAVQQSSYSYPYEEYNPYNAESPEYSAPSQIGGTEQASAVLPPATESEAVEESERHEVVPASSTVSGTVARSNGVRPLEHSTEAAEKEHTA